MKHGIFIFAALFCLIAPGRPMEGRDREPSPLRVGTYNLWRSDLGKGEYVWQNRRDKLARSIRDIGFDIYGIQEVDTTIQRALPALAGDEYKWFIFSPYSQDGKGNKAQGIVYRADRLKMLESHFFWLSPTPDVMSSGWDEMKFRRGACCAMFKDKVTGRKFFMMMSHMPLGREANMMSAPIIIDRARQYNRKNLPTFFVGDLNTRDDRPSSASFREHWSDTFLYLPEEQKDGPSGSFNGHGTNTDMESAPRIDFIYFSEGSLTPLKYVCFDRQYDGIYPSDHCPVYADFQINR